MPRSAPAAPGVRNALAHAEGLLLDEAVVPGSVRRRRARLGEPHVAALNGWAQDVARRERRHVPSFDPESGGVHAPVLVLLQDPSRVAAHGSRLISRHDNDWTAGHTHRTCTDAGLTHDRTVNWNVVPWWVQDPAIPQSERQGLAGAARRARSHLDDLLGLLPALQVVVLLGRLAQVAWRASGLAPRGVEVLCAPHPSPLAFHKTDASTGRPNKVLLAEALTAAAARIR